MCPSLRALCVGGRRLFVLVFPFATNHAEQREADQHCQKAQADQGGRGRRRRGEIIDGNNHRQREEDFQKVGHWKGRFVVSPGVQNGSGLYAFTRLLVSLSAYLRGSHPSAHGGEDLRQLFDHARAFEALADDGQDGVVARYRAAEAFGVVGVDFGGDARGVARAGAHHDEIAREFHAQKARGAEKFGRVERRCDLTHVGRVFRQDISVALLTRNLGGFELLEIARQCGLRHRITLGAQYLKELFLTPDRGSAQNEAEHIQTFVAIAHIFA